MTQPANERDKLSEDEKWDKFVRPYWEKLILPFIDAPETSPPDVKPLANFLRYSDAPLPDDFRLILAEWLDNETPSILACNWRLEPKFTGRHDQELFRIEAEGKVNDAIAKQTRAHDDQALLARRARIGVPKRPPLDDAIEDAGEAIGMGKRTVWDMREEMEARLRWWENFMKEHTPFSDEQRAEILRVMRANQISPHAPGMPATKRRFKKRGA